MKPQSKHWRVFASLVIVAAVMAGCNAGNAGMGQQGMQANRANDNRQAGPMNQQGRMNQNRDMEDRIEIADRAAERITALNGIRQANVLVTRNNAYVAALMDDGRNQLSREIEDQIAAKVRQTDPSIQNVYVSTNPEFTDRINTYVGDVQQGRPVAGFMEQFNEMVQRLFPNAR